MKLVIVESPTKARTIGRFLGKEYEIIASMGHIVDLPKSKIGIDFEHNFAPLYEVMENKRGIISELKSSAKSADQIILATDPDREGEAIAYHIAELFQKTEDRRQRADSRKTDKSDETEPLSSVSSAIRPPSSVIRPLQRIVFHEITKEAIEEALKNPRRIDTHLVDAQTARRVLDRLVGYKLSPLLWKKVRRGLSAGRVQSVALRLIVEREREIEKFGREEYFTISAILAQGPVAGFPPASAPSKGSQMRAVGIPSTRTTLRSDYTEFELIEIDGQKIEIAKTFDLYDGQYKTTKTSIDSQEKAKRIVEDLKTRIFIVSDVLQKQTKRSPAPPYTTSTLQQDAARRFGFSGKRTMMLAQKLYEEGLITYHRTDSVSISKIALFNTINYIEKTFGKNYIPQKPRFYSTKQKLAQEAHEAIRPTAVGQISNFKFQISNRAGSQGWKLYELIWQRAVASQMSDSIIESTTVLVSGRGVIPRENNYLLKANGSVLVFDGFLKVNPFGLQDTRLPQFSKEEKLSLVSMSEKEHETLPPPRYNDASIIKTLEEKGIGRPSTYATIISTIESRQYILRDRGRFSPTSIGIAVNDFLVKNFSDIDDIPFTASMEDSLDAIANGTKEWQPMMKEFYTPFEKKLEEVEGAERVKIAVEQTSELCPKCKKGNLIIRTGKFGKFLACVRFPECKFTKAFVEKTNLKCPKDGADIVIKKTRKGRRFYGCSNYPACDFAVWKLEDIKKEQSATKV